jgi:3-carboxy-cis,cis-muconate cycloisomerase
VLRLYAEELGLAEPVVPWHAVRSRVLELGAALDLAGGAAAKICLDVVLLGQDEVGEVAASRPGGSSTMPHKQNPVAAVRARACARRVHALVGTFTLEHEHERAAGAWHAEWQTLSDALALTGGAAAGARETLDGLEVDAVRMRENVRAETLAESQRLGEPVRDPQDYLGAADVFVDRALELYRSR